MAERLFMETHMTIRTIIILAFAGLLAACNTVEGAGRDISSVGKAMTKSADAAKDD